MDIVWLLTDCLVFICTLLLALLLTILFETFIAFLMGVDIKKNIKSIVIVNSLTNISLNIIIWSIYYTNLLNRLVFILPFSIEWSTVFRIIEIFLEIIVVIVEYFLYKKWLKDFDKVGIYVILANIFSYTFGILISLVI